MMVTYETFYKISKKINASENKRPMGHNAYLINLVAILNVRLLQTV